MPYKIFAIRKNGEIIGYKVGKKDRSIMDNGRRYLSDEPLSKRRAEAQLKAVGISEAGRMSSPVPVGNMDTDNYNYILFVPHGTCKSDEDVECDKASKNQALTLFKKMSGNSEVIRKQHPDYQHHESGNLHLVISKMHRGQCDIEKNICTKNTKVLEKLDKLMKQKGIGDTVLLNIKSFPRGSEMDQPNENHMVINYPKGKKETALLLREIMDEVMKKEPVLKEETNKNMLYDRYGNSPVVATLMLPDDSNF